MNIKFGSAVFQEITFSIFAEFFNKTFQSNIKCSGIPFLFYEELINCNNFRVYPEY